jgi:Protein kinase domain
MRCLLDAVGHMHAHGISHRDLKLENLVFGTKNDLSTITVVDFGLAKAARARERMEGVTGTLWYTAPEVLKGVPYAPVVDLWSLGVVLYLALTGAPLAACSRWCRRDLATPLARHRLCRSGHVVPTASAQLCTMTQWCVLRRGRSSAGEYPFEVAADDLPEPEPGWEDDYDFDEADDEAARLAAWRADKREELLEDRICDAEPKWSHQAFVDDPVALDLVQVSTAAACPLYEGRSYSFETCGVRARTEALLPRPVCCCVPAC